jgi:hypothetical protein
MKRATRKFKKYIVPQIIGGALNEPFDHPELVKKWFMVPSQKNQYFYGLATILRWKENEMKGLLKSLLLSSEKLSSEYKSNEKNYENILKIDSGDDMSEMKENMQEKVRENLNLSYQTRYSELIQKKQAYELVVQNVVDRRWYIVNSLQKDGGKEMYERIIQEASVIYDLYRGEKYRPIRQMLYMHIITIAYAPASYQNTFVLNASITGPAGSGKTTLARRMGAWFAKLGILTYDSFFRDVKGKLSLMETGRSDLIAEYTGQTAPKTLGVLARSLERTLFIDEAYSVAGCAFKDDDKLEADPYGEEFVAELLRFLNDHKGFNSMIVAGYENLMNKCFFARNEGLPRRFPQQISLPFYSTDELYGIFSKNVVLKRLTEIEILLDYNKKAKATLEENNSNLDAVNTYIDAINERKKALSMAIYWYLSVMKPSFMMIHYDTTYNGINTLRKYLTIMKIRHAGNIGNIYSWTILNHVFTNLLHDPDNSTRKQLFRRKFYEEVFHFVEPNLSYFPAQAGEMENLADDCAKKLAPLMNATNTQVSSANEKSVINDYCKGKKIELYIDDTPVGKTMSDSLGGDIAERKKKEYEELLRILVDEYKERFKEDPSDYDIPVPPAPLQGPVKKKGTVPAQDVLGLSIATVATHKSQALAKIMEVEAKLIKGFVKVVADKVVVAADSKKLENHRIYELTMIGTSYSEIRRRIHNFLELDELFKDGKIPPLTELYTMLKTEDTRKKIISHVVRLYVKKIGSDYIEEQLGESEKRFPIHLSKPFLETENEIFKQKVELDNEACGTPVTPSQNDKVIAQIKWSAIVCDIVKNLQDASVKWSNECKPSYEHNDYSAASVDTIKNRDILYEDFGISYIDS